MEVPQVLHVIGLASPFSEVYAFDFYCIFEWVTFWWPIIRPINLCIVNCLIDRFWQAVCLIDWFCSLSPAISLWPTLVARQDTDCADGNKNIRGEATLLIPRKQTQANQRVKSPRKTALIRLYDTYKRYSSSPIDRIPRRGQIVCLGSDLNQNSNLHRMSHQQASWTVSETALSELNARGSDR